MFKKLRTVIYHVDDLQKAKAWYAEITGTTPYFDEPFYVGFDFNGYELGLDPDFEEVLERGTQAVAFWKVDDIDDTVKKFTHAGAKLTSKVKEVGGGIKVATVVDPWGNAVGLIEEG
ncbi:MAG: VOC family protein [Chitinophagaceae bacterium]|nr:VOC family protein [Chitinophagaceae bacterium]